MILYLDTSAIVKLYVEEEGSSAVRSAVEAAGVVATSRVAYAETHAALAAACRLERISLAERAAAAAAFRVDWRLPDHESAMLESRFIQEGVDECGGEGGDGAARFCAADHD